MIPTNKLRFIERRVYVNKPARNVYGQEGTVSELVKKTILQQWWEWETIEQHEKQPYNTPFGEWRDVPLETE